MLDEICFIPRGKSLVKNNLHYSIISGYLRVERILKVHFLGVERRLN